MTQIFTSHVLKLFCFVILCAARSITAVGEAKKGSTPTQPKYDRSAPPIFIASNNVTLIGEFVVRKEGEPTAEELANENLMKIIGEKCTDEQVNWLLWKCLGERTGFAKRQAWSCSHRQVVGLFAGLLET